MSAAYDPVADGFAYPDPDGPWSTRHYGNAVDVGSPEHFDHVYADFHPDPFAGYSIEPGVQPASETEPERRGLGVFDAENGRRLVGVVVFPRGVTPEDEAMAHRGILPPGSYWWPAQPYAPAPSVVAHLPGGVPVRLRAPNPSDAVLILLSLILVACAAGIVYLIAYLAGIGFA